MKTWFVPTLCLLPLAAPIEASARETPTIQVAPTGIYVCDPTHPRCEPAQRKATKQGKPYLYHQFGQSTEIGDYFVISDVLENGPSIPHYQTFLSELIAKRKDANAVALWADAKAVVDDARVWGGFLSARSELPKGEDAQLIGLEVDVLNNGLPGVAPHHSKVGIQVVGFGATNSNALEILREHTKPGGHFMNIINVKEDTLAKEGTLVGLEPQTAKRGLNFLGSKFSDAALLMSTNNRIAFRSQGTADAAIWRDDIFQGHLVLTSAPSGVRITNAQNSRNILSIDNQGWIRSDSLIWNNYGWMLLSALAALGLSLVCNALIVLYLLRIRRSG